MIAWIKKDSALNGPIGSLVISGICRYDAVILRDDGLDQDVATDVSMDEILAGEILGAEVALRMAGTRFERSRSSGGLVVQRHPLIHVLRDLVSASYPGTLSLR